MVFFFNLEAPGTFYCPHQVVESPVTCALCNHTVSISIVQRVTGTVLHKVPDRCLKTASDEPISLVVSSPLDCRSVIFV